MDVQQEFDAANARVKSGELNDVVHSLAERMKTGEFGGHPGTLVCIERAEGYLLASGWSIMEASAIGLAARCKAMAETIARYDAEEQARIAEFGEPVLED